MRFPERVTLVEVGPRDGLQSLEKTYPTEVKVELVELLADAGLEKIEVTGFVHPEVIPQLADAEEVLARARRVEGCVYRALVPNRRGAERAVAAGVDEVLGLITASDTYNLKNARMSVADNLDQAVPCDNLDAGGNNQDEPDRYVMPPAKPDPRPGQKLFAGFVAHACQPHRPVAAWQVRAVWRECRDRRHNRPREVERA